MLEKDNCIALDPNSGFFQRGLALLSKFQKIPLHAQFELTARCNFNCRMCYIHMSDQRIKELGQELSTDKWLQLAREAKELGTLYLSLTGGEIFTRSDFKELYVELSKMGFLIQLMSNISMIDENVMTWLSKYPPYNISTTMYGSNNEIYRSVCGIEHGFDHFDRAINLLQSANIPITIKSVLIKDNEDDVQNMCKYATQHGKKFYSTYGVNKPVRGAISDAEKVRRMRYDFDMPKNSRLASKLTPGHGPYIHHTNYLDDCGAYGNSINITWDGHMILCSFMSEPYVDVCSIPLKEAWKLLLEKIERIQKPDKCNHCKYEEYCVRCPGGLAAECGSYSTVTDDYCKTAKYLYAYYNGEELS